MPTALKLAEAYKDKITILFVECQGLTQEKAQAFALKKNWYAPNAMWTSERPFRTGARGLPNFTLLSNQGQVLLKGHPLTMKGEIQEEVKAQLKLLKKGPKDAPKNVKKAWVDFNKNKYAQAFKALGNADDQASEDARSVFHRRIQLKINRAENMIQEGHLLEAIAWVDSLTSACKGLEEFEPKVKALKTELASPEMKSEIAAAKSLAKITKKIYSKGLDKGLVKALEKFSKKHEGAKAAKIAQQLLSAADA